MLRGPEQVAAQDSTAAAAPSRTQARGSGRQAAGRERPLQPPAQKASLPTCTRCGHPPPTCPMGTQALSTLWL